MKYIQFAVIIIIIVNFIRALLKQHDEKKTDCFDLEISSYVGLFLGRMFPAGIMSLVLSYISILGISTVWYADLLFAYMPKRRRILLTVVFFVFGIMVITISFIQR
ncbi:MAG: hypothetical protein NC428_07620 [Clostridium sp.]|nr:hypothetical protein [Clostridium sp.]